MLPPALEEHQNGAVAQLGEHLLCKQGVSGSIPLSSTKVVLDNGSIIHLKDISLHANLGLPACSV